MPDVQIQVGTLDPTSDAADLDVSLPLAGPTPLYFDSVDDAEGYPVAQAILGLDGVVAVLLQDRKVTVCREASEGPWDSLMAEVQRIIVGFFAQLPEPEGARERTESENVLMAQIQNTLNVEINPMIASHGGFIEVRDVRGADVYLNMTGGCQGCAQSAVTLRQGVERILRERIPEIGEILDATDHASGTNPYYAG